MSCRSHHQRRIEEHGSAILGVTHFWLDIYNRLTMGAVYRLFGIPRDKVTLRHAEIYITCTTAGLVLLVALAQIWTDLGWVIVVLGNLRILQIVSLNLSTLLFDFSPTSETTEAKRRARWHFVAIGFSFFDVVTVFAFTYQFFDRLYGIMNHKGKHFFDYFYYSIMTITTIGYGDLYPVTTLGRVVAMYEAMMAIFFLALFVSGALGRLNRY